MLTSASLINDYKQPNKLFFSFWGTAGRQYTHIYITEQSCARRSLFVYFAEKVELSLLVPPQALQLWPPETLLSSL